VVGKLRAAALLALQIHLLALKKLRTAALFAFKNHY
jgi:hypothetical protein